MLEKKIRRAVIETKERKEKLLIEGELFKSKLSFIFENENDLKKFKRLPEEKKVRISFNFLQEMAYQHENSLLTEQDLLGYLKSFFGGTTIGAGLLGSIAEPAVNWILSGLGMGDTFLKKFVISFLTKKEGFWNMFKSCRGLTTGIAESLVEALAMEATQKMGIGGFWESALRNAIGDLGTKTAMVESLEKSLGDMVCKYFDKATSNAKNLLTKVKGDEKKDEEVTTSGTEPVFPTS